MASRVLHSVAAQALLEVSSDAGWCNQENLNKENWN